MKRKLFGSASGEGYVDVCVLIVCSMLVLALFMRVLPVFTAKQQLDTYASELLREAEVSGRVGPETTRWEQVLNQKMDMEPEVRWSKTGPIQLNQEISLTVTLPVEIGLFGGFGSFPLNLRAEATGKSEVYWK